MSDRLYLWESIACDGAFESDFAVDAPAPDFSEDEMISQLETKYRIHKSHSIMVDITHLTAWRFIRRPHKAVVEKLIRIMKVKHRILFPFLIASRKGYEISAPCNSYMRTMCTYLVEYLFLTATTGYGSQQGNSLHSQVLAMLAILSEENPDERTTQIQAQIKRGIRAIMLHPHTPERVLTRLSACKCVEVLFLKSLPASEAFGKVQCPLNDLALMEVCYTRRLELLQNGSLHRGRRMRGGMPGDKLTLEMCLEIILDVRHIRMKANDEKPDKQAARPFAIVANNDLIDFVFEWCAENDRDEFPFSLRAMRTEGNSFHAINVVHCQLSTPL